MKNVRLSWFIRTHLTVGFIFGLASASLAQSSGPPVNSLMPVITVRATDPFASESGDTGAFTLFRDGPTNNALTVFCLFGGTASNGVDYATLPNWVNIPAGARAAAVTVAPIDDKLVEGP